jgi:hypothetical protein
MMLQGLQLSNYNVPNDVAAGFMVGKIQGHQPTSTLLLMDNCIGLFKICHYTNMVCIETAKLIPRHPALPPRIVIREIDKAGVFLDTMMQFNIVQLNAAPANVSKGSTVTIPGNLPFGTTVTIKNRTQPIDPALIFGTDDEEVESTTEVFEKAIRKQPESERNVVIPKTMIALYSEKHACCVLTKEVTVIDTMGERKKARATHVCLPNDRQDYQQQFPDAIVLGPVVGGVT